MTQLREALGDAYLAKRPSFARCVARLKKRAPELVEALDRPTYEELLKDIRRLEGLLKEANVDAEKYEVERYTVNSWSKGNFQVKAHLKAKGSPIKIPEYEPPLLDLSVTPSGPMKALCIPDIHFGFLCETKLNGDIPELEWKTIHDEKAVAVVLEVAKRYQPEQIVILGDLLDLPALSRWDVEPKHRHQTLTAIKAAHVFLKKLRASCPGTKIFLLEGNHERRLRDYLAKNAPELLGVTSVPELLGLNVLDITYVGPYGMRFPVGDKVFATHGHLIGRKGGESAAKMLGEYHLSTIFGHTHRLELAYHTHYDERNEGRVVFSMGCGTLAKLDGSVPGSQHPNWQQGFGVLWEQAPAIYLIQDGMCWMEGISIRSA